MKILRVTGKVSPSRDVRLRAPSPVSFWEQELGAARCWGFISLATEVWVFFSRKFIHARLADCVYKKNIYLVYFDKLLFQRYVAALACLIMIFYINLMVVITT